MASRYLRTSKRDQQARHTTYAHLKIAELDMAYAHLMIEALGKSGLPLVGR